MMSHLKSSKPKLLKMHKEVSLNLLNKLNPLLDIQEIENNIHLENQKLSAVTQAQRYEIEREKREFAHAKEVNVNFKRDINLNAGTEKQYLVR